jgi:hypothetical protein
MRLEASLLLGGPHLRPVYCKERPTHELHCIWMTMMSARIMIKKGYTSFHVLCPNRSS